MSLDNKYNYRRLTFFKETACSDFYLYSDVKELGARCQFAQEEILKCRTVGILQSQHGKYLCTDMDTSGLQSEVYVQVSMAYLRTPLKSTVIPYPVQVFGTLQWKNRPVIFAKIVQVLSIPMALRIRNIMSTIAAEHFATSHEDSLEEVMLSNISQSVST